MSEVTVISHGSGPSLPALIAGAGERAALRFLEFFTVNIRNKNTRAAYARAAGAFLRWCEGQGICAPRLWKRPPTPGASAPGSRE